MHIEFAVSDLEDLGTSALDVVTSDDRSDSCIDALFKVFENDGLALLDAGEHLVFPLLVGVFEHNQIVFLLFFEPPDSLQLRVYDEVPSLAVLQDHTVLGTDCVCRKLVVVPFCDGCSVSKD